MCSQKKPPATNEKIILKRENEIVKKICMNVCHKTNILTTKLANREQIIEAAEGRNICHYETNTFDISLLGKEGVGGRERKDNNLYK